MNETPKLPPNRWVPQERQKLFLSLPWYEVLFGGAKGPGKTDSLLAEAWRQIRIPGYKAILFRRTLPKLLELIDRSHKWFAGWGEWNGENHRWTFPNGSSVKFGYCKDEKDKYNYQGHEYHFMGFDQVEEFTETQYLFLISQNRSKDKSIKCYTRSTANPGNVGHAWVKRRFIDSCPPNGEPKFFKRVNDEEVATDFDDAKGLSRAYVFSTLDDNKALLENDPNYILRLEMLPPDDYRALRFGDWDAFAGQYFKEWSRNIHVIRDYDHTLPGHRFIGLDYGFAKPSSVGWYIQQPEKIVRYREFYSEGYTYEDLAYKVLSMSGDEDIRYCVADPAIWGDREHHFNKPIFKGEVVKGESGAETMQKIFGTRFSIVKGDNSRIIGWGKMHEMLKPYKNQWGQYTARFQVTENCKNFIRTIPGLIHDTAMPEDLDTTGEDHVADEVRLALMSRPITPEMPKSEPTDAENFWSMVKKDQEKLRQERQELDEGIRTLN